MTRGSANNVAWVSARVVVAVLFILLYVIRLSVVNDGFKGFPKEIFDRADVVSYEDGERGYEMSEGDIEVRVISFDSVTPEEIERKYDYVDPIASNGDVQDMRFLIVGLAVRNTSSVEKNVFVGKYELESGAWINGLNFPLFLLMNENESAQSVIASGEEERIYLPYSAYDQQFGDNWSGFDKRSFEIILAVQPKISLIDLGRFDDLRTL